MNRKSFLICLALALSSTCIFAATKTYKYRCNKCKLVQEYTTPGVKKCPNDKSVMIRMN